MGENIIILYFNRFLILEDLIVNIDLCNKFVELKNN